MIKILTRPASLAAIIGYEAGLTKNLLQKFDFSFKNIAFVLKNGSMAEYRDADETNNLRDLARYNLPCGDNKQRT